MEELEMDDKDKDFIVKSIEAMRRGEFSDDQAAKFYRYLMLIRKVSEQAERSLIRYLKYRRLMTWQEVADTLGGEHHSRQAMQRRWARLIDPNRQPPGAPGWGGKPTQ